MSAFAVVTLAAWFCVLIVASRRSRAYAIFRGVTLGVHSLVAIAIFPRFQAVLPLFALLHALVFLQSLALAKPRLRSLPYRVLVSIPSAFFGAGTLLALPWALVAVAGVELPWVGLPYVLSLIGVLQSLWSREEIVELVVTDGEQVPGLQRRRPRAGLERRPLRLVQITDPHLGPFMSVQRLRHIAERAVQREPDLVLLTGDFLTMESQADPALLARALEPLKALPGRVFACFGNHDHEAPQTVLRALRSAGVQLLMDESALVDTPAGPVQVVGLDFVWRDRAAHLRGVFARTPRIAGALRLVLLHDPGAFRHVPEGEADLVLSGHTHGGQVGLVSLGVPWTLMRVFVKAPDFGLWARGPDRLYVHRGTGHYGFPLRLGVPAEESLLLVHAPGAFGSSTVETAGPLH